jgi:hypothetical protein
MFYLFSYCFLKYSPTSGIEWDIIFFYDLISRHKMSKSTERILSGICKPGCYSYSSTHPEVMAHRTHKL